MHSTDNNVTHLLQLAQQGSSGAAEDLIKVLYPELRSLAKSWMAKTPPGGTLQPTALVHEAFVRLTGRNDGHNWEGSAHFFFAASRAMRDILIEKARSKGRIKRGGEFRKIDLENVSIAVDAQPGDLLVMDEALQKMEAQYPWEHGIVMLRFFAGMTTEEVAKLLGKSVRTIERDWRFARAWLYRALDESGVARGMSVP